jgi:hypothetical protein
LIYVPTISIHLETAKEARLMMNNEFIIPVTDETRSIKLFPDESKRHSLPGVGLSTSLKPRLNFSPLSFITTKKQQHLHRSEVNHFNLTCIVLFYQAVMLSDFGSHTI